MKKLKALSLLFIIFIIISCGRNRCGFPNDKLSWVPYRENDILTYTNQKDTIKFKVATFDKTSSVYTSYIVMDPGSCDDSAYYNTSQDPLTGYLMNETYNLVYEPKMQMQITKNDIFIFDPSYYEGDSGYIGDNYIGDSIKVEFLSETTILSQNFQNVYKLYKETRNQQPRISWIIKSKNKGIVAFYDSMTKETWYLINK